MPTARVLSGKNTCTHICLALPAQRSSCTTSHLVKVHHVMSCSRPDSQPVDWYQQQFMTLPNAETSPC